MKPGITPRSVAGQAARASLGLASACVSVAMAAACTPGNGPAGAVTLVAPAVRYLNPAVVDQDDLCIWVDGKDSSRSTLIASDKSADRLFVYDLDGRLLQTLALDKPGNIDTRPGFRLAGKVVSLVAVNSRVQRLLAVYAVDPVSRRARRRTTAVASTGAPRTGTSSLL